MRVLGACTLLVLLLPCFTTAASVGPIQKILELLSDLEAKVKAEGKAEEAEFAKFTQWCHDEERDKGFNMKATQQEIDELSATIASYEAELLLIKSRIRDQTREIGMSEKDVKSAVAVRASEHEDYMEDKKMMQDSLDELDRTINMVRKGMLAGASLLKTKGAIQKVMVAFPDSVDDLALPDRAQLDEWLQGDGDVQKMAHRQLGLVGLAGSHTGKSSSPEAMGPMLDMLQGMRDKVAKKLDDSNQEETNEQHTHEMMLASLKESLERQKETLQADQQLGSEQKRASAAAEGSLGEEKRTLQADQAYVADLQQDCGLRSREWAERQKERADELSAVRQAYEVLSNPDAQAAMGKAAMLQNGPPMLGDEEDTDRRNKMTAFLKQEAGLYKSQVLEQLADRAESGADPFAKVKGMVQDLIAKLLNEAAEESSHKSWCDEEQGKSEKSKTEKGEKVEILQGRLDQATAGAEKLSEDVTSLQQEVAKMDDSTGKATAMRNEEKAEFEAAAADFEKAIAALSQAMAVLDAYYTKGREVLLAKKTTVVAKKQPSGSFGDYNKGDTSGVMGLLEVTQSDFTRAYTEAKTAEAEAQRGYDELMEKAKITRIQKLKDIDGKKAEIVHMQSISTTSKMDRDSTQKELDAVLDYISKLRPQCGGGQVESFEERARKREDEVHALQEALAILSGEDISGGAAFLAKSKSPVKRH